MKTRFWVFASLAFLGYILSCNKSSSGGGSCTDVPVDSDSATLLAFANVYGINPTRDSSGLYYQIISLGTGQVPTKQSTFFITYTATLMSGTIFDSTTNAATTGYPFDQLIPGLQIGIPKIQVGGHIKLLIPSALAYGCLGSGSLVPPNSPVFFDLVLAKIQ